MSENPSNLPNYPGGVAAPPVFSGAGSGSSNLDLDNNIPPSRSIFRKTLSYIVWGLFALILLLFFTLGKLPEDRVKNLIMSQISPILNSRGIQLSARQVQLSLIFGPSIVLKEVSLTPPEPDQISHIELIEITPSISSLFMGRLGGAIRIQNGKTSLRLSGNGKSVRDERGGQNFLGSLSIHADHFDIGKLALLKLLLNLNGSAILDGKVEISTQADNWASTDATIEMDVKKLQLPAQTVMLMPGFRQAFPAISISTSHLNVIIDHGKGQIKAFQVGQPNSVTDDLKGGLSGDFLLAKTSQASTCNFKTTFSFSSSFLQSMSLIDALLNPGKQPDGSYSYQVSGPLLQPNWNPIGTHP